MRDGEELADECPRELTCDLCIVGAGIAGLNALFAASRYLSRGDKVVIVDRSARAGGMWLRTYDYVRLHQPHPMFTAGNIAWTLGKHRSYLATRREVVDHLDHCLTTLKQRVDVEEYYGYEYDSHEETEDEARIRCSPVEAGERPLLIRAKKCVKAFGHDVRPKAPLELSSTNVRSISPDEHDLLGDEMRESDAPIYIVGGGKTGMDTAYTLVTRFPHKKVHLLIGAGTLFTNRKLFYPNGIQRWIGRTGLERWLELGALFDGRNETEVLDRFRSTHAVGLDPRCRRHVFGILSPEENETISAGVSEVVMDYLSDVEDRSGQPTLVLRSGATRAIEPGSWIVNATGYLARDARPYEPYVSERGHVVSVQMSSIVNFLSTYSAYVLVHLFYSNRLGHIPMYEVDFGEMRQKAGDAFPFAIIAHSLHNFCLAIPALPKLATQEFGLDFERWHPTPRRILAGLRLLQFQKKNPDHLRRTLDTVRERFGVRCGPLAHVSA